MKHLTLLFLLIVLLTVLVRPVFATVSCTTQYGGGQTCVSTGELLVNKKVFDPTTNSYVDNLGQNDHVFAVGEEVTFSIEVKNVGDAVINDITLTDTLPGFLAWTDGDPLVSTITSLPAGQGATKTIRTRVINASGQGVTCANNLAQANSGQDMAQVCVNLPVGPTPVPVKETPPTGPEYLGLLLPLTGIGFWLRGVKSK